MRIIEHQSLSSDYPNGGIICICVRGVDHDEELFDIPVGEEIVKGEN